MVDGMYALNTNKKPGSRNRIVTSLSIRYVILRPNVEIPPQKIFFPTSVAVLVKVALNTK
jgi:hypothetical protein